MMISIVAFHPRSRQCGLHGASIYSGGTLYRQDVEALAWHAGDLRVQLLHRRVPIHQLLRVAVAGSVPLVALLGVERRGRLHDPLSRLGVAEHRWRGLRGGVEHASSFATAETGLAWGHC